MADNKATAQATNEEAVKPARVEADTTDWKAQARKWEERAKADYAKLAELEGVASKAADLEKQVASLALDRDRALVAAEKGVPVGLLSGSSREDFEAAADALKEWRGAGVAVGPIVAGEGSKPAPAEPDAWTKAARDIFKN